MKYFLGAAALLAATAHAQSDCTTDDNNSYCKLVDAMYVVGARESSMLVLLTASQLIHRRRRLGLLQPRDEHGPEQRRLQ